MLRDTKHTIDTPDLVAVDYEIVGLGTRFVGLALDTMLIHCITMVLILLAVLFIEILGLWEALDFGVEVMNTFTKAFIAALFMLYFILVWGYHVFFETLRHGRTPGKKLAGCQVIKLDGSPIGFRDSMLRNLLRIADYLPVFYTAGAVAVAASANGQRLGDMAAGTVVIRNTGTSYLDGKHDGAARQGLRDLQSSPDGDSLPVTDEEFELIVNFLKRAESFDGGRRLDLAFRIAHRIGRRYSIPVERYHRDPEYFLREIISGGQEL